MADPAQPVRNVNPVLVGLPSAFRSYPLPPMFGVLMRSRKNEKFAGVAKARLYVNRRFCVSVGLKMSAARGEKNAPLMTLLASPRAANRSSACLMGFVLLC